MSPIRDLALSPGELRVPARARKFLQNFVGGLVFGFCCRAVHSETAQSLRGRTQSIQEELRIEFLAGVLSLEIEQRISLCLWEDFGGV